MSAQEPRSSECHGYAIATGSGRQAKCEACAHNERKLVMPFPCDCAQCRAYRHATERNRETVTAYERDPEASWDALAAEDAAWLDPYPNYLAEEPRSRPQLMNYSYTPEWRFNGDGPAFYGMEYEINCSDEQRVMDAGYEALGDLVIFKEDNSVDGVEMVTHPMDHPWADQHLNWDVFREIGRAGGHADRSTNGIHVHVSRTAFKSESHLYRWMKLIYRNSEDVQRIARRENSSWAEFSPSHRRGHFAHVLKDKPQHSRLPEHVLDAGFGNFFRIDASLCYGTSRYDEPREFYRYANLRWVDRGSLRGWYRIVDDLTHAEIRHCLRMQRVDTTQQRYSAINTTNPDTLEVRVFASSTQPVRVRAALDLCSASVEYTRQLTAHDVAAENGWAWDRFMDWTRRQDTFNYSALISENERASR